MRERMIALRRNVNHLQRVLRGMETELEQMIGELARRGEAPLAEGGAVEEMAERVVGYLNQRAGRSFGPTAENTRHLIRCRMADGWREEDFRAVIDTMVKRWNHDKEWSIYLRPQTLFGANAESYLQAARGEQEGMDVSALEELMIRRQQEGSSKGGEGYDR